MFNIKPKTQKSGLEEEIDHILSKLANAEPFCEDYAKMADQLVKLYALKDHDRPSRVSSDTKALIAGNVLVTTIIVAYEQKAVVASKAKDFWLKVR